MSKAAWAYGYTEYAFWERSIQKTKRVFAWEKEEGQMYHVIWKLKLMNTESPFL